VSKIGGRGQTQTTEKGNQKSLHRLGGGGKLCTLFIRFSWACEVEFHRIVKHLVGGVEYAEKKKTGGGHAHPLAVKDRKNRSGRMAHEKRENV